MMWLKLPKAVIRWFASVSGKCYLRLMLKNVSLTNFRSPLLFLLTGELNEEDRSVVNRVEALRSKLAERYDEYVEVFPSPEPYPANQLVSAERKPVPGIAMRIPLSEIAKNVSVLPYWGTFLYLCANAVSAKTILELGSCAGISSCYLASGKWCSRLITIEGSDSLAILAESNLHEVAENFQVIHSLFDSGLDEVLPTLNEKVDMVYIDGHHEKSATLYYFDRLKSYANIGCIFVFDDIRWTPDMWEAWQSLCEHPGLSWTLDTGRFGICEWNGTASRGKNYDFSRFTDFWKKGKPLQAQHRQISCNGDLKIGKLQSSTKNHS